MNTKLFIIFALVAIVLAIFLNERFRLLGDLDSSASLTEELRETTERRIEEQALTISQLTNDVTVLQMKKEELRAELELANLKLEVMMEAKELWRSEAKEKKPLKESVSSSFLNSMLNSVI
jgi:hypothetical protein